MSLPLDRDNELFIALINIAIFDNVPVTDRSEKIWVENENATRITELFRDDFGAQVLICKLIDNLDDSGIGSPISYSPTSYCILRDLFTNPISIYKLRKGSEPGFLWI